MQCGISCLFPVCVLHIPSVHSGLENSYTKMWKKILLCFCTLNIIYSYVCTRTPTTLDFSSKCYTEEAEREEMKHVLEHIFFIPLSSLLGNLTARLICMHVPYITSFVLLVHLIFLCKDVEYKAGNNGTS